MLRYAMLRSTRSAQFGSGRLFDTAKWIDVMAQKRWFLFFGCFMLIAGVSAGETVDLRGECKKTVDEMQECTYHISFTELRGGDALLAIGLRMPDSIRSFNSLKYDCNEAGDGCAAKYPSVIKRDRHIVYKFQTTRRSGSVTFKLRAPNSQYRPEVKSYYVDVDGKDSSSGVVPVLSKREKASWIRPLIGGGLTWGTDDFVDFKEIDDTDERIFIENDSRLRTDVLAGGLFKLHEFKNGQTFDVAINLQFAEVGQSLLDGIFLGIGFGLTPVLEIVGGYSRGRGKELSHGFQQAMGRFIEDHRGDVRFPELRDIELADGVIADPRDYDGLPLSFVNEVGESERIFSGDPITNSFNSRWTFGVLIPLDIWKQIKSDRE